MKAGHALCEMAPRLGRGQNWGSCQRSSPQNHNQKKAHRATELELELIQSHMKQKPMLRGEVDARALRV